MDVILYVLAHVVVDDALDIIDIESSSGDICGDQDGATPLFKGVDGLLKY